MRLTLSVAYAVAILLRVVESRSKAPMTAAQIAKGCKFPPRFLYRVLRRLVDAELLRGVSGPGGGYSLAKPPRQINLLQIAKAVEVPGVTSHELIAVSAKHKKAIRAINELSRRNAARLNKDLAACTLQKLAKLK